VYLVIYDHKKQFSVLSNKVLNSIEDYFPIVGPNHSLVLEDLRLEDTPEDYKDQLKARLYGRDWAAPVKGTLKLIDSQTGRILDRKENAILANVPKTTSRFSYIVGGNEYQADHVWRRKPGIYAHIKENGEMASEFHLKGARFNINFDPDAKRFLLEYGGSNVPLYPVLKSIGLGDEQLKKAWGKEIFEVNATEDEGKALRKLNKAVTGEKGTASEGTRSFISAMGKMSLDPAISKITLGKEYTSVGPEVMLEATSKLLKLSRGKVAEDPREALMFKSLHGLEDEVENRLATNKFRLTKKIKNNLERRDSISDILSSALFTDELRSVFTKTGIANTPTQLNPLDMLEGASRTTILGPGGISSEKQVTTATRAVDPSHLGFLDPMATPEGKRVGIVSHLPPTVVRKGTTPHTVLYNLKTGEKELVPPEKMYFSKVVMPDEVEWVKENGKGVPRARRKLVNAAVEGNQFDKIPLSSADYVILGPGNMFDIATNMIPFLQNTDNARANMASRHMVQAVGLKDADIPLVMTKAGEHPTGKAAPWAKAPGWVGSTYAKEAGTVTRITQDYIYIRNDSGKVDKYSLYNDFPLNTDGAFLTSRPRVAAGDKVNQGDLLAETNFSKDGILTLGKNLRVGYMAIPGLTYEDSILVSDEAAKKLTSEHLHKKEVGKDVNTITEKKKYQAYYPTNFTSSQMAKLDDDGVAKVGEIVAPGDPIALAMRKAPPTNETRMLARLHKSLVKPYKDQATVSEFSVPAKVVRIHKDPKKISVFLKTEEPAKPGDKLSAFYGNKGVISVVAPSSEMPVDKDGKPLEVVINGQGVPSRMNPSQIYELALAKVAEKNGKPIYIRNFAHDDYNEFVQNELKKAGLEDKEELFDPKTGRPLGKVTVGPMHIIKQKHTTEKGLAVREGGPGAPYDIDRMPFRGGKESAQALAQLDHYALLANGAKGFLREVHTIRSDQDQAQELWRALQSGSPLPPPKVPFTHKKFEAYLQGLGVNLDKTGNNFRLVPASDADVKSMANGAIRNASMIRAKDLKEEEGGLFDKGITGGMDGTNWSMYRLPEPMPNPIMETALTSVVGITTAQMKDIVRGRLGVDKDGNVVPPTEGQVGGNGLKKLLKGVNVQAEIASLEKRIPRLSVQLRDKANKRLRYLRALDQAGKSPEEAYLMQNIPIIPPVFRPISTLASGDLRPADLNELYKSVILSSEALAKSKKRLPEEELGALRGSLYTELTNVMGAGSTKKRVQGGELRGILHLLHGETPKSGAFQSKLVKRRVDLSGRSVIVPDIDLDMDEVGISKKMASGIYKPFIVRELTQLGYTPLQAQDLIKENSSIADAAMAKVVKERPVFIKRDPVLHKYGVMALKPRITSGDAIRIHPLITSPMNADFDGDKVAIYPPITNEALKESWNMLPSKQLFSPATGQIVFSPTNESVLGLYKMTAMDNNKPVEYADAASAIKDVKSGKLGPTTRVNIKGLVTTGSRLRIYEALPKNLQETKILIDPSFRLSNSALRDTLQKVGKAAPDKYPSIAKSFLDLGNEHVYYNAHTLSLDDFKADKKFRDKTFAALDKELADRKNVDSDTLRRLVSAAENLIQKEHIKKNEKDPSNLLIMHNAGTKPKWGQYKQLVLAPGLMEDLPGRIVKHPVTKSFGEGLDSTGYWVKSFGARKGMIDKSLEVSEPGALTKRMVNTVMDTLITSRDCGTANGEHLVVTHPDLVDRFSAEAISSIGLKRNQLITPEIVSKAKRNGIRSIKARSPHTCEEPEGVCSRCFGLNENGVLSESGTNIGILAGQSIGERGTQLTLRTFHYGGTAGGGGVVANAMNRVQDLLYLPQTMRNSSTLSTENGAVTDITKDPAGGRNVYVAGKRHYVPANLNLLSGVKKGAKFTKGQPISTGVLNPHKLLPIVGIEKTRTAIADELDSIYANEGIRRRNIEVVTRALTNLGEVKNPGDDLSLIAGDIVKLSKALADNKNLKKPAKIEPILKGIEQIPHDQTEDWIARLNHTKLRDTIRKAVTQGYISKLHSLHPIPSLVHGAEFGLGDGINY